MIERLWFVLRLVVYWALIILAASFGRMAVFGFNEPVFSQTDTFAHSSIWLVPLVFALAGAAISFPALVLCIAAALAIGPKRLLRRPFLLVLGPPVVCMLGYAALMLLGSSRTFIEANGSPVDLVVEVEIAGYGLACTLLGLVCERFVERHGLGLGLYRRRRPASIEA